MISTSEWILQHLYSDIVLPTASWYEKADINSTDMHSFIHPLSEAIPPVWESRTDWQIFQELAKSVQEMAPHYLPDVMKDVVNVPLCHDSKDEMSQTHLLDWSKGECEAIPGKQCIRLYSRTEITRKSMTSSSL